MSDIPFIKRNFPGVHEEFEQFFTYLFNSSRDGISILDNDLTIIGINPVMERWYSHVPSITGSKCYRVYHNRSEPCQNCPTLEAMRTKRYASCIVPFEDRQSILGSQELCAFPVFDDDNNVIGIIEYVRDVTEIEKEEAVISNLKKRLRFQEQNLQEQEVALNVLIKNRQREEERIIKKILRQVNQLVTPLIESLKVRLEGREEHLFVEALESYLDEIFSHAAGQVSGTLFDLSPREKQVAALIRQGRTSKEIAVLLGISVKAVDYHRMNIRKKMNLTGRKTSLQTYLAEEDLE